MSLAIQAKTDQAIRDLTPEQLAQYAVHEKWGDLKALYEGKITEQEAEDHADVFIRKFIRPLPPGDKNQYHDTYDRLNRDEETRTAFSVAFGLASDQVLFTQTLLTAMDRLMDVAYKVREGRAVEPEDLEWTISFTEKVIPPTLMILEKRKAELKEYLEFMAGIVTFPPDQELVKTPQEVRDYMTKTQAGEEYQDDLIAPFDMPHVTMAKRLGVETEGRTYGEVCKQLQDCFHNLDTWEEVPEGVTQD
ncbi:MAG: hypothetical protein BWY80_01167 [Firmicutes bacterium ADurb.Bin456]|nr:MAG: hypothetical protein BWY80_01167 [Firmicutes bacterium ADurb.Bin456]